VLRCERVRLSLRQGWVEAVESLGFRPIALSVQRDNLHALHYRCPTTDLVLEYYSYCTSYRSCLHRTCPALDETPPPPRCSSHCRTPACFLDFTSRTARDSALRDVGGWIEGTAEGGGGGDEEEGAPAP
jgi:hypothetical protein